LFLGNRDERGYQRKTCDGAKAEAAAATEATRTPTD
jgi:hypothetical protein